MKKVFFLCCMALIGILSACGNQKNKATELPITERILNLECVNGEYFQVPGVTWLMNEEETIKNQGISQEQLLDEKALEQDTSEDGFQITERISYEEEAFDLRIYNLFVKSNLCASVYHLYFSTEEEAKDFYLKYQEELKEMEREEPTKMKFDDDSNWLEHNFRLYFMNESQSVINVWYDGDATKAPQGYIGPETTPGYLIRIIVEMGHGDWLQEKIR